MAKKNITVKILAREAGVDVDEVLVTLWDLGFERVLGPADVIPRKHLKHARRVLGVATRSELRTPSYWQKLLGLSPGELDTFLHSHGMELGRKIKLPAGAVSRLKADARARGIDPLSGAFLRAHSPSLATGVKGGSAAEPRILPELEAWEDLGHTRDLKWLSDDDVEAIHYQLVEDFEGQRDPINPPGVRDRNLLASAVFRPQASSYDTLKYPTVETSAAALIHSLVLDHPFHNGNKRTALVAALVFLDQHGIVPTCHEDELFRLVLLIAQHRICEHTEADCETQAIARWICRRSRLLVKGENIIPWRRLRRILVGYGCELCYPGGVGNRINITREVDQPRRFGKRRVRRLATQVHYDSEGRDVQIDNIRKIRADLALDESNGVDSQSFYDKDPQQTRDFIVKYRKTLDRLARL